MSFLRPHARAALWRWRESLVGLAISGLGLWMMVRSFGLIVWLGGILVLLGVAVGWAGFQRARFSVGGGGVGVVQLDEREISYFGPHDGGIVAIESLTKLELLRSFGQRPHWALFQKNAAPLLIPVDAEGAEALFDAFAALEGFEMEKMLATLRMPPHHPVVIWRKSGLRVIPFRPH